MYDYDIAISFSDDERNIALRLANALHKKHNLKVFYDDYEQAKLIGKYLTEYFIEIYKNKARYFIMLVSKSYKEKRWSRHEWRAAQARAFEEPDIPYIIPVRIDNTELPGLLNTMGYLSLKRLTIPKIANIIFDMVKSEVEILNILRTAQEHYANGHFQRAIKLVADSNFNNNIEALRIRGDAYGNLHKYQNGIKALEKLAKILPKDFLAHFLLGIFYYRVGNFEKSVREYQVAAKIYPNHPTIMTDLPAARKKLKQKQKQTGRKK